MKTLFFTFFIFIVNSTAQAYEFNHACSKQEHWSIQSKWQNEFHAAVTGKASPLSGMAEAIHLKKIAQLMTQSDFEKDFSEYWVARVLFDLKLDFLAAQAFTSVIENSSTFELKLATLTCLGEIQKRTPDLAVFHPDELAQIILSRSYSKSETDRLKESLSDALFLSLFQTYSKNKPDTLSFHKLKPFMSDLHLNLLLGLEATLNKKYAQAESFLQLFVQDFGVPSHPLLKNKLNFARILYARALYTNSKQKEAELQFQMVSKSSNEVIEALSDLAWVYMQSDRFDDLIGVALQLRLGSLKNTFAPEPLMVAAMAYHERCMYPDAIRTLALLGKDYGPAWDWLSQNQKQEDLYSLILTHLKTKNTKVPVKVMTEWIKSPAFLSRQTELNTLITHPQQFTQIDKNGSLEKKTKVIELNKELLAFMKSDKKAEIYLPLKRKIKSVNRLFRASKILAHLFHGFEKQIPKLKAELVTKINHDLNQKNKALYSLLEKVRDNSDLIEIEVYNGASHDMVWKNAHPEFEDTLDSIKEEKEKPSTAQNWNWGHYQASDIENAEVWEDELGSLKADVTNLCQKND